MPPTRPAAPVRRALGAAALMLASAFFHACGGGKVAPLRGVEYYYGVGDLGGGGDVLEAAVEVRRLHDQRRRLGADETAHGSEVEQRSWGKIAEPAIVSSVLGMLVYFFFSNR